MKILMFGMSSYPGGTENYIRNIFFHKDCSDKIQIDFITYESSLAYSDEMEKYGYTVLCVPHLKKHPVGYFNEVAKIMRNREYDAVYVNMLSAANPLPVFLARKNNVQRIIVHAHSNSTIKGIARLLLHRLGKSYCDKAATLRLSCSHTASKWLFNFENKSSPLVVIPNAIDSQKYCFSQEDRTKLRKLYRITDDEFVLGSVGRLAPEKNNFFMLDILYNLLKKGITAKLILVGDGGLRPKIENRIRELQIENNVILAGTVIDPNKYYSAFDCFLFPSSFEGFGISALEAQSCGLKCFCSDSLSKELNVTNTIRYLSLSSGAEHWAEKIMNDKEEFCPADMNKCIQESPYNIYKQRKRILEFIYGKEFTSVDSYNESE